MTRRYVIKSAFGASFKYYGGYSKHDSEPTWVYELTEAEKFKDYDSAYQELIKTDEYDWRVFRDGLYQIEELLVKS